MPALRAVFHPETPSRVLRRISDLNQLSLPDLPDLPAELPSFSETTDADSTVAHSPVKQLDTPVPPSRTDDRENRAPTSGSVDPQYTPYASTPAASALYTRSDDTVVPPHSAAPSRAGNDTNATLRGPAVREVSEASFDGQIDSLPESDIEGDGTGFQDEMVVMSSGSGGEEEDEAGGSMDARGAVEMRHAPVASLELSALPSVKPDEDTTADSESTRLSRTRGEPSVVSEAEAPATVRVS